MALVRKARAYAQAIPPILGLQLASTATLGLVLAALRRLAAWALASQSRVAVTTGDFAFLFSSWQGWLLVLLALATLYLYVALDLNAMVALSAHIVRGEPARVHSCLLEGTRSLRAFLCPDGMLTVLYIALVGPVLGVGLSISLTEGLQIPTFISSVIDTTPPYRMAYVTFALVFALLGILGLFCVHGAVIDGLPVRKARHRSRSLMREHGFDYLWQTLLFGLRAAVVVAALVLAAALLTYAVVSRLHVALTTRLVRQATIFACLGILVLTVATSLLATPFTITKMTELYLGYTTGNRVEVPVRKRHATAVLLGGSVVAVLVCAGLAVVLTDHFDDVFPVRVSTGIIAHRAGGVEGPENTVAGLRAAAALGAIGAEIDIQRTSDGAYVVNHDTSFERTTGDAREPGEMTLAEVRVLRVAGEPVATYEDMLDNAWQTGMTLFVELKGESADHLMANDAVRIAREHGMLDRCVFISLDYQLIDYLETTHPEAQTGLLAFASYGDLAALNCDYLCLEELSATRDAIQAIHDQGKRALVWTVNDEDSQRHFLLSDADAIITDDVARARELTAQLAARDDITRIADTLLSLV